MKSDFVLTVTPAQCRMARAGLDWSVRDLAERSGVHANTVVRFEKGGDVLQSTVQKMRAALEALGVEFLDGDAPGVRLRKS